jgi:hypothetical protein
MPTLLKSGFFPNAEARKETRKRKSRVSAVLMNAAEKAALEAEVEARSNPIKRNRLFSYRQEKTRKLKQLRKNVRRFESSDEEDHNECFCIELQNLPACPEHLQNGSSALSATNGPTTIAPNLATSMFVRTATLMTTLMTSCLKIDVK